MSDKESEVEIELNSDKSSDFQYSSRKRICFDDKNIERQSNLKSFPNETRKLRCRPRIKSDLGFSTLSRHEEKEIDQKFDINCTAVKPPSFTSTNEFQKHYGSEEIEENPAYIFKRNYQFPVHLQHARSLPSSPQMKRVKFAPILTTLSKEILETQESKNNLQLSSNHVENNKSLGEDKSHSVCHDKTSILLIETQTSTNSVIKTDTSINEVLISTGEVAKQLIESKTSPDKAEENADELSHRDWYKQVFKALHKTEQTPELSVHLIDTDENAIPPRPKQENQNKNRDEHVKKQNTQRDLKDMKTTRKEKRSKSLPYKEISMPEENLPNFEIHRTFQKIELDIKDDNKLKESKQENCSNDQIWKKQKSLDNEIFDNDKYWLGLVGLSNSKESLRKRMLPKSQNNTNNKINKSHLYALYNFKAQSNKELSFAQGDMIYFIGQVDKNWFEGEHNGRVGLVPSNYVRIVDDTECKHLPLPTENDKLAIVKHNFNARSMSELSLQKGDLVSLISQVDSNWFEGQIGCKSGLIPVNYVERISNLPNATLNYSEDESPRSPSSARSSSLSADHTMVCPPQFSYNPMKRLEYDQLRFNLSDSESSVTNQPRKNSGEAHKGFKEIQNNKTSYSQRNIEQRNDEKIKQHHNIDPMKCKSVKVSDILYPSYNKFHEPWYQVLYSYVPEYSDELDLEEGDLVYMMAKCEDGWWVGRSDRTKKIGTFPGNYVKQIG